MKKNYDLGDGYNAHIERTSSGYFNVVMDTPTGKYETLHSTELEALREILSYTEYDEDW